MERKAYDLLSQNKILKDSNQEPAIRVALRQIKDFAIPLQVNYENNIEIYWKWYLIDNKGAELLIKNRLLTKKEIIPDKAPEKPIQRFSQEKLMETRDTQRVSGPKEEIQKDQIKKTIDKNLFLKEIHVFFNKYKINIIETKEIKKNSELDFIIELQTQIGNTKYFCKTKNKKKINEADLSSALIYAQSKNLPLLFLTNGVLTKKTREMLKNEFKNIIIKNII